jgi:hypothetical protein
MLLLTPEQLMAEVFAEDDRYNDFDAEMRSNPYEPWTVARRFVELGDAAVPFLLGAIDRGGRDRKYALHALSAMGEGARALASSSLTARAKEHPAEFAVTLFAIDPERALELGLDRHPDSRLLIAQEIESRGRAETVAHFMRLIDGPDRESTRFALGVTGWKYFTSKIQSIAEIAPELLPVERIRREARAPERDIAVAAARLLARMHFPEDASLVLDVLHDEKLGWWELAWLAPSPESTRLLPNIDPRDLFDRVSRRHSRTSGASSRSGSARDPLRGSRWSTT